jgi:hypothetical protein
MASRVVAYAHRYKRPPRKRKAVALEVPAIVKAGKSRVPNKPTTQSDTPTASGARKSAIVTIRSRRKAAAPLPPGLLPETEEEHKRRGEAAAAMWREMVRCVRRTHDQIGTHLRTCGQQSASEPGACRADRPGGFWRDQTQWPEVSGWSCVASAPSRSSSAAHG